MRRTLPEVGAHHPRPVGSFARFRRCYHKRGRKGSPNSGSDRSPDPHARRGRRRQSDGCGQIRSYFFRPGFQSHEPDELPGPRGAQPPPPNNCIATTATIRRTRTTVSIVNSRDTSFRAPVTPAALPAQIANTIPARQNCFPGFGKLKGESQDWERRRGASRRLEQKTFFPYPVRRQHANSFSESAFL